MCVMCVMCAEMKVPAAVADVTRSISNSTPHSDIVTDGRTCTGAKQDGQDCSTPQ